MLRPDTEALWDLLKGHPSLREDGNIVFEPTQREYRLEDLMAGITKQNRHAPVDFGAPMGREAC